jgi:hypothetical protein
MSDVGSIQGYVWSNTEYSRGVVATLAEVSALPNPIMGESVFCNENMRMLTYDGELWMCGDFIKCINTSGSSRQKGDVMVVKNSTTGILPEVVSVTQTGSAYFAGVVVYTSANNAVVALAFKGIYKTKITIFGNGFASSAFQPIRTSSLGGGMETTPSAATPSAGHCGWLVEQPANGTAQLCWCLLRGKTEYYF